ncbi:MAG: hypothetical protein ABI688_04600 [Bacteroidota bacterium]
MSEIAIVTSSVKHSKKNIRATIQEKLSISLSDYRSLVGEKKFDSRIRKAARRLGDDIAKAIPKKSKKTKTNETEKAL